jgi:Flp pilus assembly protein TadG
MSILSKLVKSTEGSALLEFALVLPLLVVFIVGIYDFSGAYNQKQKIEHAAQAGAMVAAAQPRSDMYTGNVNPDSLQPAVAVVFNSLASGGVLPLANQGACSGTSPAFVGNSGLIWTYRIDGCPDSVTIVIDRGVVAAAGPPAMVGTTVTVSYLYRWRFNSAIQLLFPGASYAATTDVSETATVHNQT